MNTQSSTTAKVVQQSFDHITLTEAKGALLKSGYLLESRVATLLNSKGYEVTANSVYPDTDTGKSREYDIHAYFDYRVNDKLDFIVPTLLIECVNNPQPIAFITKDQRLAHTTWETYKLAGLPLSIRLRKNAWQSLPMFLHMPEYHHYRSGRIATQFCSFTQKKSQDRKGQEWMAHHDNEHFDAFRKLSAVVEHEIDKCYIYLKVLRVENLYIQCFYPIVVVQGELLEVHPSKKSLRLSKIKHAQYLHSTFFRGKVTSYQVDVITEGFLPSYLAIIKREAKKSARLLNSQYEIVNNSIDLAVKRIRQAKSPKLVREALEFHYGFEGI